MSFPTLEQFSLGAALCSGVAYLIAAVRESGKPDLGTLLNTCMAGAGIPAGLWLIYCGFFPASLTKVEGYALYVAIAGIAVMWVAGGSIVSSCRKPKARIETHATPEVPQKATEKAP